MIEIKQKQPNYINSLLKSIYQILSFLTAIIGYTIHGNIFYSIVNFLLAPVSWIWWFIGHDVNISIIRETFKFFYI